MAGSVVGNKSSVFRAFVNSSLSFDASTSADDDGDEDSADDSLYDMFLNMAGTRYAFNGLRVVFAEAMAVGVDSAKLLTRNPRAMTG